MMPFNRLYRLSLLLPLFFCSGPVFAQMQLDTTTKAAPPPKITKVPKFRAPKVQTYLGGYTADTARIISVDEGKNIIGLYLRVTDKNNAAYTITHYGFSYKRIGVTEDEQTGDVSPETDVRADEFTTTPLSPIWISSVKETLHSGEELMFYDIIVKDSKGRIFFAPNLHFVIQ